MKYLDKMLWAYGGQKQLVFFDIGNAFQEKSDHEK